ncbi:MAG: hypothetical protein ACTFAK_01720 [Candidatus Electronema sp. VV]
MKQLEKDGQEDIMRQQLAATRELVRPAPAVNVGAIDVAAWKQTEAVMLREKQIEKAVRVEQCLKARQPAH